MDKNIKKNEAKNHAMLFAYISRIAYETVGHDSFESLRKSIRKYGNQRGRRMAQRALHDGKELNYFNYLVYSEWEAKQGEVKNEFSIDGSNTNMIVYKCPWYDAWNDSDMIDFGKIYCDVIDFALVEGFNLELKFKLNELRPRGNRKCDFTLVDSCLCSDDLDQIKKIKDYMRDSAKEDWAYHIAHLFKVIKEQLDYDFPDFSDQILAKALDIYKIQFGQERYDDVLILFDIDFENIRNYDSYFHKG